jgi:hypothetical protein
MRNNPFEDMRASELLAVINDTIFRKDTDRDIAINIFVKSMTVEKCASIVGYDWKTVQKRLPNIQTKLTQSLHK